MRQRSAVSQFPTWKYWLILVIMVLGFVYSAPNLFGEDPAVQISGSGAISVTDQTYQQVQDVLTQDKLSYKSLSRESEGLILIRFNDTDTQLKATDAIRKAIGDNFTVALNLAPATPTWLRKIGASPMRLGLDLRGGIHMLLQVDVDSVVERRLQSDSRSFRDEMRQSNVRYTGVRIQPDKSMQIRFRDNSDLDQGRGILARKFPNYQFTNATAASSPTLDARMTDNAMIQASQQVMDQTMTVLRNRVNELGIAEPIVQQQGADRVAVDLPGIQDSAQAKQILGGTATLEFRLVDEQHSVQSAVSGDVPAGSRLYQMTDGTPILLKDQIILKGESISSAMSGYGEDGRPNVSITIGGSGVSYFSRVTGENIGHRLGIVYIETKTTEQEVGGKMQPVTRKLERVINAAVIQSRLPSTFQITGLDSPQEARNLSILLRAGALPTNMYIVEESNVGPSLGKDNIDKGVVSVIVGFALVVLFMGLYYRYFGLIANLALGLNLVLIVAVLSLLGATLTLPGIAAIVLTLGMAVDANVLIFERIREELRLGMTPNAAITAGYERAFVTIVDANVTTLIVAVVLFAVGTGVVKGFAVNLIIGLLTSMFTAITFTRGIVHWHYGGRQIKKLSIGV